MKASQAIAHDFPRAMFVLMPIFGLLTWALYGKARRFYAAHLYYSLHFHAFVFLALAFELVLILALQGRLRAVYWLAPTAAAVYLCVSLRRVFGGGFLQTAWKATLLWFVYVFLIIATMVGVGLVSVRGDVPGASTAPGITAH